MFRKLKRYIHNVLVGADQFANTLLAGKPGETISSRAQRAADRGNPLGEAVSEALDVAQEDHGHKAMKGDLKRAQDVEETEKESLGDA